MSNTPTTTPDYPFVQAKNYNRVGKRDIHLVVLHTMEFPDKPGTAKQCADWFADKGAPKFPAPQASAHYCCDDMDIIQCVHEMDVAWHAPGANHDGIGIEMAGFARYTIQDWHEPGRLMMLDRVAMLVADICDRYNLPTDYRDAKVLLMPEFRLGITTHRQVSLAYKGTHIDPGENFPMGEFLNMVAEKRNPYT